MKHNSRWSLMGGLLVCLFTMQACAPKNPFKLAETGPYAFGTKMNYTFIDASRGNREVEIMVWYPAKLAEDAPESDYNFDAPPDYAGAPYPLIVSSAKVGSIFGPHLASHGFVVVGVKGLDYYIPWNENLIDQPLDILFALDQVSKTSLEGLEEVIESEKAGAMGYSFDGYNALAMSGARLDPQFYLSQCEQASSMKPELSDFWIDYYCHLSQDWEAFAAHAGDKLTSSTDGLWQPMTDARLKAVMPMGPEGAWLFGPRGLAAVDRPILIINGTEDVDTDYRREASYIYEHLGTPSKALISFIGEDHMMVFSDEPLAKIKHFTTAFFGYYLQGKEHYARYFAEDFVERQQGLAWGVYNGD